MKKNFTLVIVALSIIVGMAFDILGSNGRAGASGSPADNFHKCADCHTSSGGGGSIYLTSNMPNWKYSAGQTYTINCTVKQIGMPLFGYDLEVLDASTNLSVGILGLINGNTMSQFIQLGLVGNVIHTGAAGLQNDSATFSFTWTAPTTNVPNAIKFWYCGNAANNDGFSGPGDFSIDGSQVATVASATGIKDNKISTEVLQTNYNEESKLLSIIYNATSNSLADIIVTNLNGQQITSSYGLDVISGKNIFKISLPLNIRSGVYLVSLRTKERVVSNKFLVEN
jgi:hypothetical protein